MTNWSSLLSTKCEDRDSFLSFYLKTKWILHKLTKGHSIVYKDAIFLKTYFSMDIEAKELQTEVKGFLRDKHNTYSETFELIHADFQVQTSWENLRDITTQSGSTAIMRSGKTDNDVVPNKTDTLARTYMPFPNNHAKLLPSKYYYQFREWYVILSMMKIDRKSRKLHGSTISNLTLM